MSPTRSGSPPRCRASHAAHATRTHLYIALARDVAPMLMVDLSSDSHVIPVPRRLRERLCTSFPVSSTLYDGRRNGFKWSSRDRQGFRAPQQVRSVCIHTLADNRYTSKELDSTLVANVGIIILKATFNFWHSFWSDHFMPGIGLLGS